MTKEYDTATALQQVPEEHQVKVNRYRPEEDAPTLADFHYSHVFYRGIMGPVGSGKSTACCFEIWTRAQEQEAQFDDVRRTRWAVVRNTYRELEDTTLKTWLDWFPEEVYGKVNRGKMTHILFYKHPSNDGTWVHCEVMFRALDRPDDVKKLLSMELTGGWINEAREIPKAIVDALGDRVERYPAVKDGGCTWAGVIMDTNPPEEKHWWYMLAERERPSNFAFFRQPGGLLELKGGVFVDNPDAENVKNLATRYYLKRVGGKKLAYVRVMYCGQYGFVQDGQPVYPEYNDTIHFDKRCIGPIPGLPIYIGIDFGLTPAAIFAQKTAMGKWRVFDEICSTRWGAKQLAEVLGPRMRSIYAGYTFYVFGDPAGDTPSELDSDQTPFLILNKHGIPAVPAAPNNDQLLRKEAMRAPLTRMIDGEPGLVVGPNAPTFRAGLGGGYRYKQIQSSGSGEERYHEKPDKNAYSHPCEAGEYLLLGAGEGAALIELEQDNDDTFERTTSGKWSRG